MRLRVIIFSKDRPAQLDLLLRTMASTWEWAEPYVIFTASNSLSERGYDRCCDLHPAATWVEEDGFAADTLKAMAGERLIMFAVDDVVVTDSARVDLALAAMDNPEVLTASLRLHPGIRHCYAQSKATAVPVITDGLIQWAAGAGDWGYPMSLDCHVFRVEDIRGVDQSFANPNEFEVALGKIASRAPLMHVQPRACLINVPHNRVQDTFANRNAGGSVHELNIQFLLGRRLTDRGMRGQQHPAVHHQYRLETEPGMARIDDFIVRHHYRGDPVWEPLDEGVPSAAGGRHHNYRISQSIHADALVGRDFSTYEVYLKQDRQSEHSVQHFQDLHNSFRLDRIGKIKVTKEGVVTDGVHRLACMFQRGITHLSSDAIQVGSGLDFITAADLQAQGSKDPKYWSNWRDRWPYTRRATEILATLPIRSAKHVLELGTMGVQAVKGSTTLDYPSEDQWKDRFVPDVAHDARGTPWPFRDDEFDVVVALRVFQHLKPNQREALDEALRVAPVVLMVLSSTPSHDRGISPDMLQEWGHEPEIVEPFSIGWTPHNTLYLIRR